MITKSRDLSSKNVHVCFAISDESGKYSKFPGTAVYSILANTNSNVHIHVMHNEYFSIENKLNFCKICDEFQQKISFYDMTKIISEIRTIATEKIHWMFMKLFTDAVFYKLVIWDIIPSDIDKIIWLDGDIIVNLDIKELWQEDVGGNGVAAVLDPAIAVLGKSRLCKDGILNQNEYFNVGVLLLKRNEMYIPMSDLIEGFGAFFDEYTQTDYPEQDFLNFLYAGECNYLEEKYNTLVTWSLYNKKYIVDKKIYHYSRQCLGLNMKDVYDELFMEYFTKTPWYNLSFIKRLMNAVNQLEKEANLFLDWSNIIRQL